MSYLKLALSQCILSAKRYFPEWEESRERLAFSKGDLLRTVVDFSEPSAGRLLESIWVHLPQGYLFARQRLSLLSEFPTDDLTAMTREAQLEQNDHLVSRFSWELASENTTFQTDW